MLHFVIEGLLLGILAIAIVLVVVYLLDVAVHHAFYKRFYKNHLSPKSSLDRKIMKKVDAGVLQLTLTEVKEKTEATK